MNGVLVTKVRINAVIATIGVGTTLTGIGFSYSAFPIAIGMPRAFTEISLGRMFFGLPNPVLLMLIVLVVLWTILNKTDIGQKMQAVGSNIEAARLSGIRVDRIKMFAFATAGFCAALTGILLSSLLGSGTLAAADGYLLDAFAAVFLGSATLREGQFHIVGTLVGVLVLAVGFNGLSIFGAPTYFQPIFKGVVLILAVGLSTLARRHAATAWSSLFFARPISSARKCASAASRARQADQLRQHARQCTKARPKSLDHAADDVLSPRVHHRIDASCVLRSRTPERTREWVRGWRHNPRRGGGGRLVRDGA